MNHFILADDALFQCLFHFENLVGFGLRDFLHGYAGHHGDDVGNIIFLHRRNNVFFGFFPAALGGVQLAVQALLLIAQHRGPLEFLVLDDDVFFLADMLDFFFELGNFFGNDNIGEMDAGAVWCKGAIGDETERGLRGMAGIDAAMGGETS